MKPKHQLALYEGFGPTRAETKLSFGNMLDATVTLGSSSRGGFGRMCHAWRTVLVGHCVAVSPGIGSGDP